MMMEENINNEATTELTEEDAMRIILNSLVHYRAWARDNLLTPKATKYDMLTDEEKKLFHWFPNYLKKLEHSIDINSRYFEMVAESMGPFWGVGNPDTEYNKSNTDFPNLINLMNQFVREWSSDGMVERDISFGRILKYAEKYFPNIEFRPDIEVLVPGSGLGRLVVEFSKLGFKTQGTEISYFMLFNSHFLLNRAFVSNNFVLCPFIHKSSNNLKSNFQCRQIYFPDFNAEEIYQLEKDYPSIKSDDLMSMIAGDFDDLYGPPGVAKKGQTTMDDPNAMAFREGNVGRFKIIATSFFIDTATNIIDYIKAIKHSLSDDGYWINFGPLLWHHEHSEKFYDTDWKRPTGEIVKVRMPAQGLEISMEDLIDLIEEMGFQFIEHESGIKSSYGSDSRSMSEWNYKCEFWVCKKKHQNN